jgi:hypothetical protein
VNLGDELASLTGLVVYMTDIISLINQSCPTVTYALKMDVEL